MAHSEVKIYPYTTHYTLQKNFHIRTVHLDIIKVLFIHQLMC